MDTEIDSFLEREGKVITGGFLLATFSKSLDLIQ